MGLVVAAFDARLNRRVALKVMPSGPDVPHEMSLVGEDQAMGRLQHPNVVAVYDSGQLDASTRFIAMEYVEGQTLQSWNEDHPRDWSEILEAYRQAGAGLHAAHQAGLIHRDFKPLNVLVGADGRVRVTDFGLAREDTPKTPPPFEPYAAAPPRPRQLLGTLKYMAPEVLTGHSADVGSDVFAFCVALYEALYRQPAFPGETKEAQLQAKREGRFSALPRKTSVPPWLGRSVVRGLAASPAQRPSMRELLRLLRPPIRARKRVGMVMMLLVALGSWGWWQSTYRSCHSVALRLHGVWDDDVKAKVRAALLATHASYAQSTNTLVETALDAYADSWVKTGAELCQRKALPKIRLLQEACLERKRRHFQNLTLLLSERADEALLSKAVSAAQALTPVDACTDDKALAARVPPPEVAEVRAQVEALDGRLLRLQTLSEAGRYQDALLGFDALLRATEATHYPPLQAQALYTLSDLEDRTSQLDIAEQRIRQAIPLAAEAGDPLTVAHGWLLLHRILRRQAKFPEAMALVLPLEAAVEQSGDARVRASGLSAQGTLRYELGDYAEALKKYHQALPIREAALGPNHSEVGRLLNNIGMVQAGLGNYPDALESHRRALAIYEHAFGPKHPDVAWSLSSTGGVLFAVSEYAEALNLFERSLEIQKSVFGENHPEVAESYNNIGAVQLAQGRCSDALVSHRRALAIQHKSLGEENFQAEASLTKIGEAWLCLNETGLAFESFQQSISILEKAFDSEHPDLAIPMVGVGKVLTRRQEYKQALRWFERALDLQERLLGRAHANVTDTLVEMGILFVAQRRFDRAIPILERALGQANSNQQKARAQLILAEALWGIPRDRVRAVALAHESRAWWHASSHPTERHVESWLASHVLSHQSRGASPASK